MVMLSKNKMQFIQSLHLKKNRLEINQFLAEGEKIVEGLLQSDFEIEIICATPKWIEANKILLKPVLHLVETVDESMLKRISTLSTPNNVLALAKCKQPLFDYNLIEKQLVLILDDINDPGNLGTIIRVAEWFNISTIICSEKTVELYNPKTVQSTMGSVFKVNVFYRNLDAFIPEYIKTTGNFVYAAVIDGSDLYKKHLHSNAAIVIGSESHGISKHLLKSIPEKITIPSFQTTASVDSLNAAVATGIIVSEFKRRMDIGL